MSKLTKEEKERRLAERRKLKYNETHKLINGIDHKLCNKCCEWVECNESNFYKNKSNGVDGFHPYCKKCAINKTLEWEEKNPEKLKINRKRTDENRKEKHKLYRHISKERGYQDWWRRNNSEKLKEYQRKRNKEKKHEINNEEWLSCKAYFEHKCAYCGITEKEHKSIHKQQLHKEHVKHGGSNKLDNCVPACKNCNSQKRDYEFLDWYNTNNPIFNQERIDKINKWLNKDYKLFMK